jgi:hypothetical protein
MNMQSSKIKRESQSFPRRWVFFIFVSLLILRGEFTGWSSTEFIIQTVAGTGDAGFSGDGGPATKAMLNDPAAVAVSACGTLYIADVRNNRIRQVDATGIISTVAGSGRAGFSGDGGLAIQAQLSQPLGLAVDGEGNLYIADTLNNRIRKVDAMGRISTVAGNGKAGFSGDGGPALAAMLSRPVGLTVDAEGNVYFADVFNNCVRKLDTAGQISTLAGTEEAGFSGDGGLAVEAQLARPRDVAVDGEGNLYIADGDNNRIRRVDKNGIISTVAGNGDPGFSGDGGPAVQASLNNPRSVALDGAGQILISDLGNNRIRQVDRAGMISTIVGNGTAGFSGDGGPAVPASLDGPRGVCVNKTGALFIADLNNHRVRVAR